MSEQLYRVTAGAACFGIVVEEGVVTRAAPIAGAAAGKAWSVVQGWYPKAAVAIVPPVGWSLQEGAGGWRCVQPDRKWETVVYLEKAGGAAKAVEAAIELEEKAALVLAEQQRLCASLRSCFREEHAHDDE